MMRAMIRWFRGVAVVEAISYLVLLAASAAKHVLGASDLVSALGPVHGVIFLAYAALALAIRTRVGWNWTTLGTVIVAAAIPFGAIVVERRLPADQPAAVAATPTAQRT
jgi:integral membrane protein